MNFLTYIHDKITIPLSAPDSWADVPFKTFVAYNKLIENGEADNQARIYSLFMPNVSADYWDKPHHPKLYKSINKQLNFISEEPSKEVPTHVVHDNYDIIRPNSIDEVTANQYWGTLKAADEVLKGKGTNATTLEVMPEMIAILMFKETDGKTIAELSKEIAELPTDKIYGLGCFFLEKLHDLKHGTTKICLVKRLMKRMLVQGIAELVIITVILSRLITCRKGSLVSVWSYLKRKSLKFTFKYKYLLIFKSAKENIQTS
mgnify:FL=1